jgi:hypothetical protein
MSGGLDSYLGALGGFAKAPQLNVPPEAAKQALEAALDFLRAGGTITLAEWVRLAPEARALYLAAGDRLRSQVLGTLALAIREEGVARKLLEPGTGDDGGKGARTRKAIERAFGDAATGVVGPDENATEPKAGTP